MCVCGGGGGGGGRSMNFYVSLLFRFGRRVLRSRNTCQFAVVLATGPCSVVIAAGGSCSTRNLLSLLVKF